MIETTKKTYEKLSKALSITLATLLLVLGFAAIIYITSTALEIINSKTGAGDSTITITGLSGLLNVAIIIFAVGIGAAISIPYAVYVIDKLRSREGRGALEEEI